ncbi:hypothetical protein ETH_00026760, partial [Eimeria tenella]
FGFATPNMMTSLERSTSTPFKALHAMCTTRAAPGVMFFWL